MSTTQPAGTSLTLSVTATGGGLSYQWKKGEVAIDGATQSTLTFASLQASDAEYYSVVVTNSLGTATSRWARVMVETPTASEVVNLSIRGIAGRSSAPLIAGFVTRPTGSRTLLMRALGPTLLTFGVSDALTDPSMAVYDLSGTQLAANDNWENSADLAAIKAATSAYVGWSLAAGSKDSAVILDCPDVRTVHVSPTSASQGTVLAEAFSTSTGSGRLVNFSANNYVAGTDDVTIMGFVVSGSTPVQALIRGIGPKLTAVGVTGVMPDPKIELYFRKKRYDASGSLVEDAQVLVAANDNWGTETGADAASRAVSGLHPDEGSKDAVILMTLWPGEYTAQVRSANGVGGRVMLEFYEVR